MIKIAKTIEELKEGIRKENEVILKIIEDLKKKMQKQINDDKEHIKLDEKQKKENEEWVKEHKRRFSEELKILMIEWNRKRKEDEAGYHKIIALINKYGRTLIELEKQIEHNNDLLRESDPKKLVSDLKNQIDTEMKLAVDFTTGVKTEVVPVAKAVEKVDKEMDKAEKEIEEIKRSLEEAPRNVKRIKWLLDKDEKIVDVEIKKGMTLATLKGRFSERLIDVRQLILSRKDMSSDDRFKLAQIYNRSIRKKIERALINQGFLRNTKEKIIFKQAIPIIGVDDLKRATKVEERVAQQMSARKRAA